MILTIESCHEQRFINRDIKRDGRFWLGRQRYWRESEPTEFSIRPRRSHQTEWFQASSVSPPSNLNTSAESDVFSHQHNWSPLRSRYIMFGLPFSDSSLSWSAHAEYEQQRLHLLLHKHVADRKKTKRMDPKEVDLLMEGGAGQGDIFTWREKNRRKVSDLVQFNHLISSVYFDWDRHNQEDIGKEQKASLTFAQSQHWIYPHLLRFTELNFTELVVDNSVPDVLICPVIRKYNSDEKEDRAQEGFNSSADLALSSFRISSGNVQFRT